jgi:membrane associated rhomboid family serine protease
MQKTKSVITIAALAVIYILCFHQDVAALGYTRSNVAAHFYYMFFHANVFHLAGNCLGAYYLVRNIKSLVAAYGVSVALSFIIYAPFPTVGFSAPLYVLAGIYGRLFQRNPFKEPSLLITYVLLVAGLFIPHLNGLLHIAALGCGVLISLFSRFVKQIQYDYRKTCKGK